VKRLGILISGRGSNFEAIADNVAAGTIDAEIAVAISNRAGARGLETARERGLNAVCLPSKGLDREVYDRMLLEELELKPLLDLNMRLGEASGAAAALLMLRAALACHTGMATFAEAGVSDKPPDEAAEPKAAG